MNPVRFEPKRFGGAKYPAFCLSRRERYRGTRGCNLKGSRFLLSVALPDYDFTRQEIAMFLLYIEGNSARMRVTRIRLDLSTRKGAGKDVWKPSLTITDRRPLSTG